MTVPNNDHHKGGECEDSIEAEIYNELREIVSCSTQAALYSKHVSLLGLEIFDLLKKEDPSDAYENEIF